MFSEGAAPEWRMDTAAGRVPKPTDGKEWRRGFKVSTFSQEFDGVREFATNGVGAGLGVIELHEAWETEKGQHPGAVPVVQFVGATAERRGKGSTSIPHFKIVQWVKRPDALRQLSLSLAEHHEVEVEAKVETETKVKTKVETGFSDYQAPLTKVDV